MSLQEFFDSVVNDGHLVGSAESAVMLPPGTVQAFRDGTQRLFLHEINLLLKYMDGFVLLNGEGALWGETAKQDT